MWEYNCKKGVQNTHHRSERTETATENGVDLAGSCRHCISHSSVASLIAPNQWCVFCTPSLAVFSNTLLSTGFKSGEFGRHSWGWIDSGVSFCNNSTVACAQWTFQVSQGSVETLFRWGGKRLHHFAANLFRNSLPISSKSTKFQIQTL